MVATGKYRKTNVPHCHFAHNFHMNWPENEARPLVNNRGYTLIIPEQYLPFLIISNVVRRV